jgi:hypothetical protein
MDELVSSLQSPVIAGEIGILPILGSLTLTFFLCLVLALFYRRSYGERFYSVSLGHTIIMMGITIALIMLVIRRNIAPAFALVGAMSIIRFRNPIKNSRNLSFLFMAMGIGMAVGLGFYLIGIVFTAFVCAMIFVADHFSIGARTSMQRLLRVHIPQNLDHSSIFNDLFLRSLHDHSLLSEETLREGSIVELIYEIQFKKGIREAQFIDEVRAINGNHKVGLFSTPEMLYD